MLQENHNYQITKNRRFCTKKYKLIWLGKNTWSTHSQRWVPQLPINSWSWNHCGKSSRGIISIIIRGQRRENDWWEVLDMEKRINKNHYNPTIQIQYISILNITFNSHHCPWGFDNTRKKIMRSGCRWKDCRLRLHRIYHQASPYGSVAAPGYTRAGGTRWCSTCVQVPEFLSAHQLVRLAFYKMLSFYMKLLDTLTYVQFANV